MKKTLVAVAVAAFATSASALTVYENEGSKVEMNGKVAVALTKEAKKVNGQTKQRAHSNLANDGTRFGVTVKHNVNDDLYALGRLEFRFNGKQFVEKNGQVVEQANLNGFGDLYAHRAYVGLGNKQFGELTFGRQNTIGNDIAQSDFANAYGVFSTTLTTNGKSVLRYDYKGVEGLQVGLSYRFADQRTEVNGIDGEVPNKGLKGGYDVGAKYSFKPQEGQSVTVAAGYSRDNFKTETSKKAHKDAYAAGVKFTVADLTLAADYAGAFSKKVDLTKERFNGFRVGASYTVAPNVDVYGNYGRGVTKKTNTQNVSTKETINKYMLGTSYQVHKNVFTYVEGGFVRSKSMKDRNVAAGLSVSW